MNRPTKMVALGLTTFCVGLMVANASWLINPNLVSLSWPINAVGIIAGLWLLIILIQNP